MAYALRALARLAVTEATRLFQRLSPVGSPAGQLPIFAYWDGDDHSLLTPFRAEWQAAFPQFRIFSDDDVGPLIARHFPDCLDLYKSIRIPAAKADIARLILLYELGGLYVDCHLTCSPETQPI